MHPEPQWLACLGQSDLHDSPAGAGHRCSSAAARTGCCRCDTGRCCRPPSASQAPPPCPADMRVRAPRSLHPRPHARLRTPGGPDGGRPGRAARRTALQARHARGEGGCVPGAAGRRRAPLSALRQRPHVCGGQLRHAGGRGPLPGLPGAHRPGVLGGGAGRQLRREPKADAARTARRTLARGARWGRGPAAAQGAER